MLLQNIISFSPINIGPYNPSELKRWHAFYGPSTSNLLLQSCPPLDRPYLNTFLYFTLQKNLI
jgi:hypothetical protein